MKFKTKDFPRQTMLDVLYGEAGTIVRDEITDNSRWSIHHFLIFSLDGQLYSSQYSEGATEYQDERPWEYEDTVTCTLMQQVERLVTDYEAIPE